MVESHSSLGVSLGKLARVPRVIIWIKIERSGLRLEGILTGKI